MYKKEFLMDDGIMFGRTAYNDGEEKKRHTKMQIGKLSITTVDVTIDPTNDGGLLLVSPRFFFFFEPLFTSCAHSSPAPHILQHFPKAHGSA
jgi:hypothetical protein